ncbi:MAG: hypothetical protein GXO02_00035, partial [Epsilonproteobacteria bacterium]|nr:hypothetical protein [Campylobacterota bacterium]
ILQRSIKDIFSPIILKEVIVSALFLFIFWAILLLFLWEPLFKISQKMIDWLPFTMVREDGAIFILFFVWIIAVMVSFSLIVSLFVPLFSKRDKNPYYYISAILLFFALFWGWIFLSNWSFLVKNLAFKLLTWLPFKTVQEAVAFLLTFYIVYNLFVLSLYFLIAFYRKDFLFVIKEMEYPNLNINLDQNQQHYSHKKVLFRDGILYLIFIFLFFPLFFIPIVNIVIQLALWMWLYGNGVFISICNMVCSKDDFNRLKDKKINIYFISFLAAILNFIPILNIFAPFLLYILAFHWIIEEIKGVKE